MRVTDLHGDPGECDFTREFNTLPVAVALDLDDRYRVWRLDMTSSITIVPAKYFDWVDGLIV